MKIVEIISPLYEVGVPVLTSEQIAARRLYGPVYHGTTEPNQQEIDAGGFKMGGNNAGFLGDFYPRYPGIPPVHTLGNGIYFSPSRNVARAFGRGSASHLIEYYLDVPRMAHIGFKDRRRMWVWWTQNGYNFNTAVLNGRDPRDPSQTEARSLAIQEQIRATAEMTEILRAKYDAVHLRRGSIDDEQIVVFDPKRIYSAMPSQHPLNVVGTPKET